MNLMTRILLSRDNLLTVMRETDMDLGVDNPAAREAMVGQLAGSIKVNALSKRPSPPNQHLRDQVRLQIGRDGLQGGIQSA